jgi:hypothetical protein
VAFTGIYKYFGSAGYDSPARSVRILLFHAAVFVSAVAAFNMEVVTGFNVEAMLHYPNRLFQPFLTLAAFAFVATTLTRGLRSFGLHRVQRLGRFVVIAVVTALLAVGGTRQVLTSYNVAYAHEYTEQRRLLFGWLNVNARLDDVVLATAKDINDLIPVYTQARVFVPSGERTSASNEDIGQRFLIAMKLFQHSEGDVRAVLAQDVDHGEPPLGLTYTYFLFLGVDRWRLPDSTIDYLLSQYRTLDLSRELGRWRLDYVYGSGPEWPAEVSGWTFSEAYADGYGHLWRIEPLGAEVRVGQPD